MWVWHAASARSIWTMNAVLNKCFSFYYDIPWCVCIHVYIGEVPGTFQWAFVKSYSYIRRIDIHTDLTDKTHSISSSNSQTQHGYQSLWMTSTIQARRYEGSRTVHAYNDIDCRSSGYYRSFAISSEILSFSGHWSWYFVLNEITCDSSRGWSQQLNSFAWA